ncbi:MAG: TlpA disulfide reductase family protein [Candidatus Hydrogenedentes bacterium]|nr:TlpA disulfide reductase family protein [Candidatus Hydrogenedentota bacterium]
MQFPIVTIPFAWCAGTYLRRTTAFFVCAFVVLSGCSQPVAVQNNEAALPTPASTPVLELPVPPPASPETPATVAPVVTGEVSLANPEKLKMLLDGAKGKTLVINVWATFCVPCLEEMPELAQFYTERDADKIAFLSLSADPLYSFDDVVKPFVAERKIPFPVYVLEDVPPDTLIEMLGVESSKWSGELPGTFVLDGDGVLKHSWLERVHLDDLKTSVASVVAG